MILVSTRDPRDTRKNRSPRLDTHQTQIGSEQAVGHPAGPASGARELRRQTPAASCFLFHPFF
jgi:hypothetical protein